MRFDQRSTPADAVCLMLLSVVAAGSVFHCADRATDLCTLPLNDLVKSEVKLLMGIASS